MQRTAAMDSEEDFFVLSDLPPSRAQKRLALAVVLVMVIVFLITAGPLSGIQTVRVAAFVPAYTTALVLSETITAVLLFAQFSILRTRALLVISSGYLFSALMVVVWMLTFPGVVQPTGLIGGPQSTSYLHFFWHAGFPIFVIGYALLKDADSSKRFWRGTVSAAITLSVALTAATVAAAGFLFITGEALLPRLLQLDSLHPSSLLPYVGWPIVLLSIAALTVLWTRRRSVLDLWLIVVMCTFAIELCLSYVLAPVRYSFGWYAGRVFGLICSSLVLLVLLYEITRLYVRLVRVVRAHRREREARLVTGDAVAATIAHEVKQPLAGMITSGDAGLRFLSRTVPDLDEAKEAFRQIVADGHRADAIIGSVRAIFRKDVQDRDAVDINGLVSDTVALAREDLHKHRIVARIELNEQLPKITGNRIQLQQVMLNLIMNAIESMAFGGGPRLLGVRSDIGEAGSVTVSVADSGPGISPQDMEQIFTPLFTTKAEGMGMGLLICRSIIEAHEGRLWASPNTPCGAVFQFNLPA